MAQKQRVTISKALMLAGAVDVKSNGPVYHALGSLVARHPKRFDAGFDQRGRRIVSTEAVRRWYLRYRPRRENAQKSDLTIYLNRSGQKNDLRQKVLEMGLNSVSEMIRLIADNQLVVTRPDEAGD